MVVSDKKLGFLLKEVAQLKKHGYKLDIKCDSVSVFLIGNLEFTAVFAEEQITDSYWLKIIIPERYPLAPPTVKETGGRIPRVVDFHVFPDHTLCLGPPPEVLKKFKCDPTILGFVENLLIPKLFWHSYNAIHPEAPLPAYVHGDKGIEKYRDETNLKEIYFIVLESDDINVVLLLLKMLIDETYKSNPKCPCPSGQKLKDCHGKLLQTLLDMPYWKPEHKKCDYDKMFQEAKENGEINDIRPFSAKRKSGRFIKKRLKKRK